MDQKVDYQSYISGLNQLSLGLGDKRVSFREKAEDEVHETFSSEEYDRRSRPLESEDNNNNRDGHCCARPERERASTRNYIDETMFSLMIPYLPPKTLLHFCQCNKSHWSLMGSFTIYSMFADQLKRSGLYCIHESQASFMPKNSSGTISTSNSNSTISNSSSNSTGEKEEQKEEKEKSFGHGHTKDTDTSREHLQEQGQYGALVFRDLCFYQFKVTQILCALRAALHSQGSIILEQFFHFATFMEQHWDEDVLAACFLPDIADIAITDISEINDNISDITDMTDIPSSDIANTTDMTDITDITDIADLILSRCGWELEDIFLSYCLHLRRLHLQRLLRERLQVSLRLSLRLMRV